MYLGKWRISSFILNGKKISRSLKCANVLQFMSHLVKCSEFFGAQEYEEEQLLS